MSKRPAVVPDTLHHLHVPGPKHLAKDEGEDKVVQGVAIRYGTAFERWGDEFWQLEAGCFTELADADVRMLREHDPVMLLGRTVAGSLTLDDTAEALNFRCLLPDSPAGQDVFALCSRGDLDACSIGFRVTRHEWIDRDNGKYEFVVKEATLREISLTATPVFEESSATAAAEAFHRSYPRPARRPALRPPIASLIGV